MLLANKLDIAEKNLETRMILIEEAERICEEQGIYWGGECSAKTFEEDQIKEIIKKFMIEIYLKFGNTNTLLKKKIKKIKSKFQNF